MVFRSGSSRQSVLGPGIVFFRGEQFWHKASDRFREIL